MEYPLSEIGQIAITVSDMSVALPYFRDVLGLKYLFDAGPHLAFLSAGSVRIMLSTPERSARVGANSVLYFKVTDLAATYPAIVGRGSAGEQGPELVARMPDHELWMAFLRDPDGNLIGLMEERR